MFNASKLISYIMFFKLWVVISLVDYAVILVVETSEFMAQRFVTLISMFQIVDHNLLMDCEIVSRLQPSF